MGAGANRNGNKSLNDRRERGAGRQNDRLGAREAIQDAAGVTPGKGRGAAGGAYGHRRAANQILDKGPAVKNGDIPNVGRSRRPAKKRS
jgi:hypothetical protein